MRRIFFVAVLAAITLAGQDSSQVSRPGFEDTPYLPGQPWHVHDSRRPHPGTVTPGTESTPQQPGKAPSDAIVLFDGRDLSHWMTSRNGKLSAPAWKLGNGFMEVAVGTGDLVSKEKFGDAQIHVEWTAPLPPHGSSQERGNSGVIIMSHYEIQVLDNYQNPTYADGYAGAIYGQFPPLALPARPPGQWQTYDIVFEAPRFENGKVIKPAYATVLYNGVLVQNHQAIIGAVAYREVGAYKPHAAEEPLMLQDHGNPVRFRNVWVRPLPHAS
jgi:hypothetical protein